MVPLQTEDLTTLSPENSPFARRIAELPEEKTIFDMFRLPEEYIEKLNEDRRKLGGIANFIDKDQFIGSPTATEEAINKQRIVLERKFLSGYWKTNKEEDKMGEEMWSLYQVIAVDKEDKSKVTPNIDKRVIAKNAEHAKGIAGVTDLLKKYDYDNTKVRVHTEWIMNIRPVEDDE